jgi:PAS domain S-box-containing protein
MRASNQSFFEVDLRTRRAMLSSEHLRMLRHLAREETVPYEQLRDRRHPDDVERLDRMYDEYAAGTRASHDEELRLLTADGEWIWVLSHGQVSEWDENGRPIRVVGTSTDITQRKRTEAALVAERALLRTLLDTLPDIVFVKDREARYVLCNAAATRHCGLVRESDMVGRTVYDLYPEDMARLYHADDLRTLAGESILNREEPGIDDAGRPAWFLTIKVPLRDASGTITGMLGVSRDITEHKRAEELIRRTQKMEALGTLAGGIAHDFNNILLAINGNARLAIADLPEGHPALESLSEISRAGARAAELVRRILAFSRPQDVRRDVVDLRLVVEEAVKLLRPTLPAMIELECRFAPDAPAVTGDAGQIHQVIMNLVTNAAHAIGERVGHIGIAVDHVQLGEDAMAIAGDLPDGTYARLSVSDDGSGMDALTQERIFDPFFTTKPAGQGTGLGLSVVHGILRAHQGSISVYSQPGKGTTFHCYLPAATGPALPVETARLENVHGRGERVLYVDDEPALVQLAKRSLQRLGYRVAAFDDPIGALHEFRARPSDYDLVITDLSMPGMSGFELSREILARRPDIPIIMTSGYVRPQDEETARTLGIRAVVLKPGTVEELGTTLRELLGERVH